MIRINLQEEIYNSQRAPGRYRLIELGHHLFDTMYHAAAITHPNAVLITADNRFRAKGEPMGRILPLPQPALWIPSIMESEIEILQV